MSLIAEDRPQPVYASPTCFLARCTHPRLCPHGRPTRVRIPPEDVARWFGRTGWRRQ